MRYVFFINPAAGKGVAQQKIAAEIRAYFNEHEADYRIVFTRFPGEAEQLARQEAQKGDRLRIFACGGEGTGYEVINGIAGYDNVEFGVIHCGSANDFLKYFGGDAAFLDISAQIEGEAVPIDLIRAGERYCINSCSVGMDAMVARDMRLFKRWPFVSGKAAYTLAVVRTFVRKLGVKIALSVDGETQGELRCLSALIANAPYYGGGYKGAPDAKPNDGILDLTVVRAISRFRAPKFLAHYKKGDFKQFDYCMLSRCESMSFISDHPLPVNLDGETIETYAMIFSIARGALNFILPRGISAP